MEDTVRIEDHTIGEEGKPRHVFSARVSLPEILFYISGGWLAYAAETVKPKTWRAKQPPIKAKAEITSETVPQLERHSILNMRVVFIPKEFRKDWERYFEKAEEARTERHQQKTQRRQELVAHARERITNAIRWGVALIKNLQGMPVGPEEVERDPVLVQFLTEAAEAIDEIQEVILLVGHNLLNGDGKRFAELEGAPALEDADAHRSFRYGTVSLSIIHHCKRLAAREKDAMAESYPDIETIESIDAEYASCVFLAALFQNMALFAGTSAEDHAERSAQIYELIRSQKPSLPAVVAELIREHGHQWTKRHVLCLASLETNGGNAAIRSRAYSQTDAPGMAGWPEEQLSFTNATSSSSVRLNRLSSRHLASVIVLTVAERIVDGCHNGIAVTESIEGLAALPRGLYARTEDVARVQNQGLPMWAYVLAAASNAYRVLPKRALVAFGTDESVLEGMPLGISLGHPEDPTAPWCLIVARRGLHKLLPSAGTNQTLATYQPGKLHRTSQLFLALGLEDPNSLWQRVDRRIIGFVDDATYNHICSPIQERIPRLLQILREK